MKFVFRGKDAVTGEWVYGSLVGDDVIIPAGQSYELDEGFCENLYGVEVLAETVGISTGEKDINGKDIYTGDLVITKYNDGDICSIGDIQFDCGVFGVEWAYHKKSKTLVGSWGQRHNLRRFDDDLIDRLEVIGNIFDNADLLEANFKKLKKELSKK